MWSSCGDSGVSCVVSEIDSPTIPFAAKGAAEDWLGYQFANSLSFLLLPFLFVFLFFVLFHFVLFHFAFLLFVLLVFVLFRFLVVLFGVAGSGALSIDATAA